MIRSNGVVWLPIVKAFALPPDSAFLSKQIDCDIIHKRCVHVSEDTIRKMSALGIKVFQNTIVLERIIFVTSVLSANRL